MSQSPELQPIHDSDRLKARLRETQILFRQQKYVEAKKILQEILKDDPENAVAYNNLGSIYLIRGRFARAERYFKKALEIDPGLEDASENLNAIEKLRKKKKSDNIDNEIDVLEEKARNDVKEGRIEEALETYRRIIEIDPTNIKVYNNLGILHFQRDEYPDAESYFVKAMEMYFQHGMVFDEQYTIIRENLAKMREKIGSNVTDFIKDNLSVQLKNSLGEDEMVVISIMGQMEVPHKGDTFEVNTMLSITTNYLILNYKTPQEFGNESRQIDLKHTEIHGSRIIKGIRKSTLIVSTARGDFKISATNLHDLRKIHKELKVIVEKRKDSPLSGAESLRVEYSESMHKAVISMLDALAELGVFTAEEIKAKKQQLEQSKRPPAKPFSRSRGLIPAKPNT